jgi:hypothetical protein
MSRPAPLPARGGPPRQAAVRREDRFRVPPRRDAPQPNGEGGIRTRGKDKPYTAFPRPLLRPLGHLSNGLSRPPGIVILRETAKRASRNARKRPAQARGTAPDGGLGRNFRKMVNQTGTQRGPARLRDHSEPCKYRQAPARGEGAPGEQVDRMPAATTIRLPSGPARPARRARNRNLSKEEQCQ